MAEQAAPKTLQEAVIRFADKQVAHDYFVRQRFPNGVACPRQGCGSADVAAIKNRNMWRCRECGRQFSVRVGTIFEDSPIGFNKWLPCMWLISNCRNGVSSYEVARALHVTQKTAWFMLHRLRLAMRADDAEPFVGAVEVDETFVGGKRRATMTTPLGFKRLPHGPATGKTTVFGMVQRADGDKPSKARAMVVPDHSAATLLPIIRKNVWPGSVLYTDAMRAYRTTEAQYVHYAIDHAVRYVDGHITTNRVENFWSCLKRTLNGTYIAPRAFHLGAYVDEQVFRFNVRHDADGQRFVEALKGTDGRRLTWKALTGAHPRWRNLGTHRSAPRA